MKKLIFFLVLTGVVQGCKNKPNPEEMAAKNSFFEKDFSDYKELNALRDYEKQIDTLVYMGGSQDKYRLLNLRKNNSYLVLFYKVVKWDEQGIQPVSYRAIDTIMVKNSREDERVTVGYCYHEDYFEGEVIALIKPDGETETTEIIKAWRANPKTEDIEILKDHKGIKCLDQFFERDNATIPIEKLS